jgi:Ca2+-binding RTX toxin-like protein
MTAGLISGSGTLVTGLGGSAGFGETVIDRNDDGYQLIANISSVFESGINFFGTTYTSMYVNTNGSISFANGISQYTPSTISGGSTPIIAPYWADVDTRIPAVNGTDSPPIYFDADATTDIITITWPGVDYYAYHGDLHNWFQLQLYDRGNRNFDIVFRYQDIQWVTGDASGGTGGFGGTAARAGFSAGDGLNFYELAASGNEGALVSLESTFGNSNVQGLWQFQVRNGEVLKYASDIFSQDGYLGFMAELANGSYRLRRDNSTTVGINEAEVVAANVNNADGPTAGASYLRADQQLHLMTATDMPTLALTSVANASYPTRGLADGIYTNLNASALIGRCADALFVSFRGTNDVSNAFTAFINGNTPDSAQWTNHAAYYALFADLRAAITSYVGNTANGIAHVYVTGHSLGGGAAHAFMQEHASDTRYQAVTFASLGFGTDTADPRIINLVNGNDAVTYASSSIIQGSSGDDNIITNQVSLLNVIGPGTSHSMDLYYDEVQALRASGIDGPQISGTDGILPDYDSIITSAYATNTNAGIFDIANRNEVLLGTSIAEMIVNGPGNDNTYAYGGDDAVYGGAGLDVLQGGEGNDHLYGGTGFDYLFGDNGNDELVGGDSVDVLYGGAGNDTLRGGADTDHLFGGVGIDTLYGDDGNDIFYGDAAPGDVMYGGAGQDYFYLYGGGATCYGGAGVDVLLGGAGNDTLYGGAGVDYFYGGAGSNTYVVDASDGSEVIYDFHAGFDTINFHGTNLTSYAAVVASESYYGGISTTIVTTTGGAAVWFIGLTPDQLSASNFLFT